MGLEKLRSIRMTRGQRRLWGLLQFLVRLIMLSLPIYLILFFAADMTPLQEAVATQSAHVLRGLGYAVVQDGYELTVGTGDDFYFMINEDCTGWKSMLFLFALIFAVPGISMRKRLAGLAIGLPVVWTGNLGRVVGVVVAERAWGFGYAMMLHDYGYRLGLALLVLLIWFIWLRFSTRKDRTVWDRLTELFRLKQ
jgi:exosortase/archaeosortase family protein